MTKKVTPPKIIKTRVWKALAQAVLLMPPKLT